VADNHITGTVPHELCQKHLNEKKIDNDVINERSNSTSVSDKPRTNGTKRTLFFNKDFERGCDSVACPVGHYSTNNNGMYPCVECEHNGRSPFLGSSKCYSINTNDILAEFYNATNGDFWTRGNWKNSSLPYCDKIGITCASNGNIIGIQLPNMTLTGTIIEELALLKHLEVVDLSDNSLHGTIPSMLGMLPLETFDVSGNQLTGFIDPNLCTKLGINGNGKDGVTSCDVIACAAGTFNKIGRATHTSTRCISCPTNTFLGSKSCKSILFTSHDLLASSVLLCLLGVVGGLAFFLIDKSYFRKDDTVDSDFGEEYPFHFDSPIGDSPISWEADNYFSEHSTVEFVSEKEERSSLSSATSLLEITKAKMVSSSISITKVSRKSNASVSTIRSDTSSSADGPREIWMDVPKMT